MSGAASRTALSVAFALMRSQARKSHAAAHQPVRAIGLPVDVTYHPARAFDVPVNVLDIGRASWAGSRGVGLKR